MSRDYLNQVRAMLHAWEKYGLEAAEQEHLSKWRRGHRSPFATPLSYKAVVRGKIQYIRMIRGPQNPTYQRLARKLTMLDPTFDEPQLSAKRDKIFVSYARKDMSILEKFEPHFDALAQDVKFWVDKRAIQPGDEWEREIEEALNETCIAILLVSKNFLASQFIRDTELPYILETKSREELTIFWVYVEECLYDQTPLKNIQAANDISKPLVSLSENEQNNIIVQILRHVIDVYRSPSVLDGN